MKGRSRWMVFSGMPSARSRGGFTLIELLVVIAIVGLLSSIVLASVNQARAKSRDARRIADMKQLQLALELYFDDNGKYPEDPSKVGWLYNNCTQNPNGNTFGDLFQGELGPYLAQVPRDPLAPGGSAASPFPYCYFYLVNSAHAGVRDACGGLVHPYTLVFSTETSRFSGIKAYDDPAQQSTYGWAGKYCLFP